MTGGGPWTAGTVGVVVLDYRSHDDTLACLASLEVSDDLDLDVLVVDNGPEGPDHDALVAAVGGRAEVVATGANLGYAAGNNVGLRRLRERGHRLFWILNPDTRVRPDTLPLLRAHLEAVPDCGVVGPRVVLPGPPDRISFDGGVVDLERHGATAHLGAGVLVEEAAAPVARDVDYVTGASLLVRREVLDTVGLVPEHYFLYFEETDWCTRVRAAGWRVMVEQHAVMDHLKRSSATLPTPAYLYYMTRNRLLFAQHLGADPAAALEDFRETFLAPWRRTVERHAPDWTPVLDTLVERAVADATAGRTGRTVLDDVPTPGNPRTDDKARA